jgi:ribosome recycling factor
MTLKFDKSLEDVNRRMVAALDVLNREFSGIRAGRAHPSLLESIKVDSYGSLVPIAQVGNVSAPEPRLLVIQVWDKGNVKAVEKAITDANIGLNPQAEGLTIRMSLPHLTEDRRKDLSKLAGKYTEEAKICARNVRRDGMEVLKKKEKNKEISEDELRRLETEIQEITDHHIKKMEEMLSAKQKDIMQV